MTSEKGKSTIGRDVYISMPELGLSQIPCKVDTGAYGCSINAVCEELDDGRLRAHIETLPGSIVPCDFDDFSTKSVKSSSGETILRYKVVIAIEIEGKRIKSSFTFADRTKLIYPALIGRRTLASRFLVDSSKSVVNKRQLAKDRGITLNLEELDEE